MLPFHGILIRVLHSCSDYYGLFVDLMEERLGETCYLGEAFWM